MAKNSQLQIRVSSAEKAAISRAARRAGMDVSSWVLGRLLPPAAHRFQQLTATLARETPPRRRYVLAELHDLLAGLGAAAFLEAAGDRPAERLDEWTANYVAAMVETTAHQLGVSPPAWTGAIPPLRLPVFGSALPGLRLHLLLNAPPAFKRRNIFIDSTIGDRV